MKESAYKEVQVFIEKLGNTDSVKHQIIEASRRLVFENYPNAAERMMYGGILFSLEEDFGGVFAYKNHVSFEFSIGYQFNDPEKLLEGNGKYRRHVKIRCLDEVKTKKLDFFVKQAQMDDQ
ncbi:DUF1801 domain-containing protein [Labilibaculum antarcticum]|uniref:YdhG-like domain-containing protein n=1 Tax=Labilibaculum antarcticum TaxID=1717717 RepID=A0A1Y1CEE8_9BACT|nr:DUF1801 domain-containing protein [Labilibaculum antarcticum]BAX78739.1 hypothetical protein ALGA_0344 [Labilibaculum antarcticum]